MGDNPSDSYLLLSGICWFKSLGEPWFLLYNFTVDYGPLSKGLDCWYWIYDKKNSNSVLRHKFFSAAWKCVFLITSQNFIEQTKLCNGGSCFVTIMKDSRWKKILNFKFQNLSVSEAFIRYKLLLHGQCMRLSVIISLHLIDSAIYKGHL